MQAPTPSQRSIQRRSPAADPGPPPTVPARAISPQSIPQARASNASARTTQSAGGSRRQAGTVAAPAAQPSAPLSQIEKSVTHLLVATKQLLETLTQWSRHQATDAQVSDVYVRLGYEFNIACRAFAAINVDTADLGNVPELLRNILESTLSQEASVESLDRYLPKIRDIIIGLLHGLKRKQQKLRQKQAKENGDPASLPRNSSTSSVSSGNTGLTTLLNEGLPDDYRDDEYYARDGVPPRVSSAPGGSPNRRALPPRDTSRRSNSSEQSSLSSTTMQNLPVLAPGDDSGVIPMPPQPEFVDEPSRSGRGEFNVEDFPPPPLPPKQQNALAALQRGGELERRASRRYSAYQISKHLGAPGGVPMLPAAQNSPIPNRGRELRESMTAVRGRGAHSRQRSNQPVVNEPSPSRVPSRISEGSELSERERPTIAPPEPVVGNDSPIAKTPEDKLRQPFSEGLDRPLSANLSGPPSDALPLPIPTEDSGDSDFSADPPKRDRSQKVPKTFPNPTSHFSLESSPPPEGELTLFLQYKSKIKKFILPEGVSELSTARLQLAFIEKFAWNTHHNGVDLPEIYIQDPVSGVRHELEDLSDIKDRSVLVLNIEVLDEVKRHIDEGIGGLKKIVEGVKTAVDDQKISIQRVSDRQQDAAKEMARLALQPVQTQVQPQTQTPRGSYTNAQMNGILLSPGKVNSAAQLSEIQSLRRDLAVLRQTYSGFQADIEKSMSTIRTKAASVKTIALKAAIPDIKGDAGRSYVNSGKKSLNQDSDKLVGRVDDLQDIVEDLRKDVVIRGVRPLPRQLETVAKDISLAAQDLKKMQDYLKRERPVWTKIWEKELETVCNDREEMTMQEDLAADLQDDLEKATQTFALVEQATKEQLKDAPGGAIAPKAISRGMNVTADPSLAKEGVLGEVRALQPNHENRLEAIERAEKLRQRELESRGNEFQKELGDFVEEGKLKKAGGFEEVERARKAKDDRIRKEVWERQNGMTQADAQNLPDVPVEGEETVAPAEEDPNEI